MQFKFSGFPKVLPPSSEVSGSYTSQVLRKKEIMAGRDLGYYVEDVFFVGPFELMFLATSY